MDNATEMKNSTGVGVNPYWEEDVGMAVFYSVMFLLIVPLNILVILTVLKEEYRKNRLHYFILHLAIADLLVGIINVLGDGINSSLFGVWYGGDVLCRVWGYLKVVVLIASNNLLIGLSIDRLLAIAFPMIFMKRGSRLYRVFIIGAWVIGLVVAGFYLFYSSTKGHICGIAVPKHWRMAYFVVVMITIYILPTLIITLCYVNICIVVWRKWAENQRLHEPTKRQTDGPNTHVETAHGLLSKAKVKSIKMTLVICLAFFLCWTPYFALMLMSMFGHANAAVSTVTGGLYCLNSLCNPLVFILFNRDKFCTGQICGRTTAQEEVPEAEEQVTLETFD